MSLRRKLIWRPSTWKNLNAWGLIEYKITKYQPFIYGVAMSIRCKMRLENVVPYAQTGQVKAIFACHYDQKLCEEDKAFMKATPWGQVEFIVDNPKAIEQLAIGAHYYFDIAPVPATA
jgi:hypothetical protein